MLTVSMMIVDIALLRPICIMGKICDPINPDYYNELWAFTKPQISANKCNAVKYHAIRQ